jgi:hypothetical protein
VPLQQDHTGRGVQESRGVGIEGGAFVKRGTLQLRIRAALAPQRHLLSVGLPKPD